ncbi:MAG: nucleotide exchange factor GrpE [Candidatus Liptonbacteria bacterium]
MSEEKNNDPVGSEETTSPTGQTEPNEFEKCKAERDEYLAGWQRAKADLINYKKDEFKRLEEAAKYQLEDVVYDLVAVLDNFDLALSAMEKQGQADKGIYLIRTQLEDVLKRRGLNKISVSPGDSFNPAVMEAIAVVESDVPPDKITEVIEIGYKIYEKILRPARVKVSKEKS